MIGFSASYAYDLADMFWLARLGKDSVAAVTIFFSVYWVISSAKPGSFTIRSVKE